LAGILQDEEKAELKESFVEEQVGEEARALVLTVLGLE